VSAGAAASSTVTAASTVVAFSASLLLVAGGATKLRRPAASMRALHAAGLPSLRSSARSLGLTEMAIGVAFLTSPGRVTGALLAGAYLAFAAFLASLLIRHVAVASCGCAGERDLPPSWLHVVLDVVAAGAALALAVASPSPAGLWRSAAQQPLSGVPFVLGLALIAWLAAHVVAYVPMLYRSYDGSVVP
jgi:hypothetical protein